MYAAITHVDKQSFPFSDVLRACFYEIANHANKNGAKGVSLIAGNIFCKTVQMHSDVIIITTIMVLVIVISTVIIGVVKRCFARSTC